MITTIFLQVKQSCGQMGDLIMGQNIFLSGIYIDIHITDSQSKFIDKRLAPGLNNQMESSIFVQSIVPSE